MDSCSKVGSTVREEKGRREKVTEEKGRRKKIKMRANVEKTRTTCFSLRRVEMRHEKLHAGVA